MKPNIFLIFIFFLFLTTTLFFSCGEKDTPSDPSDIDKFVEDTLAKGADIGWLTEMEASGKKFYNASGSEMECMALLKSLGVNSIRLRVWVNPADGWCNTQDMVSKALRAKALDMRIMIDFHYSDSWADPGKQNKPALWSGLSFDNLKTRLENYTEDVLKELKDNNISPEWVQIGNEVGDGMLWEDGRASKNMSNFAALVSSGYRAVKTIFPSCKVIVHVNNGWDNGLFRWLFDGLKNNGAKWDVIGMSLYPGPGSWQEMNRQCNANMIDMVSRYGSEVIICEVGMSWDSPEESKAFLTDIISRNRKLKSGKGQGVFFWEPQCYGGWNSYTLGAFDNTGKPTIAMDAFK